jgi:predicted HTH transcriptional regulator
MATLTLDQVLKAAQTGEDSDWEFKSAKGGLPGSLWETYSAMANSEGGWILLGAREENGIVQLDGLATDTLAKYKKSLWDGLHNRQQVSTNLLSLSDVQDVFLDCSILLAIHVPPASASQRPIHIGSNPMGHTFRRRHEGDYRCTDAEVRRMLADADPTPADQRVLSHFSLTDLDAPSLAQYRQRFKLVKGDHAWLNLGDQDLLENLGGWRMDRESGQSGLTVAGLLMFGKDLAIRDAAALPEYFVDYREKLDFQVRWTDRIYPDGTWEANLFQFYHRVWPKLATGLPTPFRLEGGIRRDETPAHVALREAFINALIHADYSAPGGIVLERYPDRFVFDNPGILMVSLQQFRRGGISSCRNKSLQRMFLMIGGGEQAGSGIDKIKQGW